MNKFFKKPAFLLFLILCLAAFLRLYRLDEVPPSLFGDEVDVGYQAFSILKTGRDYFGNFLPLHFHSLSDWRTPLFLYTTVPFVWLFGLNEWGVRLAPALFGILGILVFYLLTKKLFKKENLALLSALVVAISPWYLTYSRAAFEVTQMLFLILLGVFFFFRSLEKKGQKLFLASLFLGLAPYTYNTAKLFIPLLLGLLVVCFWPKIKKIPLKKISLALIVLGLVALPMAGDIFFGEGADRFSVLSIFTDPTVEPQIGFDRLVDAGITLENKPDNFVPGLASRIFHNKYLFWGTTFLTNYFKAFSTEFLFTFGDINFRHSVQGNFGQLFWPEAVFLLLGLYWLVAKFNQKDKKWFLIGWLLFAPIPSALTRDGGNHATRLILMLPPLLILVSLGIKQLIAFIEKGKQKWGWLMVLGAYFFVFSLWAHRYLVHWPLESEEWWHPGFKQAGEYVLAHAGEYEQIIWSESNEPPLIFLLFWTKLDPKIFQQAEFQKTVLSQNLETTFIPGTKYYWGTLPEKYAQNYDYQGALNSKMLYLMPETEIHTNLEVTPLPPGLELLEIIKFPSGRPGMYLVTGKGNGEV